MSTRSSALIDEIKSCWVVEVWSRNRRERIRAGDTAAFGQLFEDQPTDREVGAVRSFNDVMAREPRVQAVIVPIGDGLWVGVTRSA